MRLAGALAALLCLALTAEAEPPPAPVLAASTPAAAPANVKPAPAQKHRSAKPLPLDFLDAANPGDTMAVFLSGDGGWVWFDQHVGGDLAARGVPTIGFDTGEYFSVMRTPEDAARALADTLRAGFKRWKASKAIIVGYSFGADMSPFMVNRLPVDLRKRVTEVALMSPADKASFQVTLAERAGLDFPGARPTEPEFDKLIAGGVRVECLHGEADTDSFCLRLEAKHGVRQHVMEGGHTFNDKHEQIAEALLLSPLN
jgi:type IV secretory pathway VirJ component